LHDSVIFGEVEECAEDFAGFVFAAFEDQPAWRLGEL
jgi:hypothetical protein